MSDWLTATLLGIIEGITEFLPISSTGHLLLAQHWIPLPAAWNDSQRELFDVVIQCGAVLAVLAVFSARVKSMITNWREPKTLDYLLKLAVAFGITGACCLILKKVGLVLPKDMAPIAWATLIGGGFILAVEYAMRKKTLPSDITWRIAITVGLAQVLAASCPGTSRSGASILFAMAVGLSRPAATEFSFLVGIPTMMAAGLYEIHHVLKHASPGQAQPWGLVLLGTLVAAVTAFVVVKWLLHYVQNHTFTGFGWYRIIMGGAILIALWKHCLV